MNTLYLKLTLHACIVEHMQQAALLMGEPASTSNNSSSSSSSSTTAAAVSDSGADSTAASQALLLALPVLHLTNRVARLSLSAAQVHNILMLLN
jgi:hypothetical protein